MIADPLMNNNAWPFVEARRILERIGNKAPTKGYVLFETGYGPSGLPHIGTFAEVARTTMVSRAFEQISDIPTKLFCFSDDMDGLRKVPTNIPNQDLISQNLGKPLSSVPDPFGVTESYGHYMNAKLREFLDKFGFEYEFFSATQCYKAGLFDNMMIMVVERYEQIMDLMLPTFREERQATYSPFMPICKKTGQVLQVPIKKVDKVNFTVTYKDSDQELVTTSVTGGHCKLQWKPDFGMRWAALGVDYEMYGKDHMPNSHLYSEISKILGGVPPVQFFYEMFLSEDGAKISKSKGNSIGVDDWLLYAPLESLSLFMYMSPSKAKRLHFDVIPKCVDEYLAFNKKFHNEQLEKQLENPVYHIHGGKVPDIQTFGISFGLLLNLASVCNPDNKSIIWGFISKYTRGATPESAPYLDHLVEFAIRYYDDFIKANKQYLAPSHSQIEVLKEIKKYLLSIQDNQATAEEIQNKIYEIGTNAGYENLRDYFKELYQILLGQTEGPRFGSFIKLFGVSEFIGVIESKITP